MRAGDLDAAVGAEVMHREIQHRRRPAADPQDLEPALAQPFAQRLRELGRAQPAVEAQADARAALAAQERRVGAAKRMGIGSTQRLADDAADVVLAQHRRVEAVAGGLRRSGAHALFLASLSSGRLTSGRPMLE